MSSKYYVTLSLIKNIKCLRDLKRNHRATEASKTSSISDRVISTAHKNKTNIGHEAPNSNIMTFKRNRNSEDFQPFNFKRINMEA